MYVVCIDSIGSVLYCIQWYSSIALHCIEIQLLQKHAHFYYHVLNSLLGDPQGFQRDNNINAIYLDSMSTAQYTCTMGPYR